MQRIKLFKNFFVFALFTGMALGLVTQLSGCASAPSLSDSASAEAAFKEATDFENDERYEEALTKFNEVKNKHPYSKFASESELHIADIQYKKEAFIEAQNAYQLFKDFHPKNPKIDYVTYRLAMSLFMQLPSTSDRDLTPSTKAIQYFTEVINAYPTSQYVKDSEDKKLSCLKMLAEKESYIGNFYFIREKYDSAEKRYSGLLVKYPHLGFDEEALYRAGLSAFYQGEKDDGKKYLENLLEKFPESTYVSRAKSALEKYGH
jgi:outer membrane protein assembly factor BamD